MCRTPHHNNIPNVPVFLLPGAQALVVARWSGSGEIPGPMSGTAHGWLLHALAWLMISSLPPHVGYVLSTTDVCVDLRTMPPRLLLR